MYGMLAWQRCIEERNKYDTFCTVLDGDAQITTWPKCSTSCTSFMDSVEIL